MPHRVRGMAVFPSDDVESVPYALLHDLKHNQVLHDRMIVLKVLPCDMPRVDASLRIESESLDNGVWTVIARHGFVERPDVPEFIRSFAYPRGLACDAMTTSYFTSRASVVVGHLPRMNPLRQALFIWMQRNASRASDCFLRPGNCVVELGQRT
ncbi:MAG: KUP/HAK/KT family potassium transporter [Janthinobacterium lividum]